MAASAGRNVVLTGFMGSGKTTVGRIVAHQLGWAFLDTDALIVARHGPIHAIFTEHGEAAFRAHEREVAIEAAAGWQQVIATGGRMMLDPPNAEVLSATGRVFCLIVDAAEVYRRLQADPDGPMRPLLAGDDPATAIARLLDERADGYGQFEQVPAAGRTPAAIATDIINRLRS
ncbi:shikimate kinase [Candidatus Poriferisodalis sp.]|uniref:shikimate kinase n=1 Tax=Candidatus Poriferisodalis sp. TaxID=3101277 RepID=UPI003B0108EF